MRLLFPFVAVLVSGLSLAIEFLAPKPASSACLNGFCRQDQIQQHLGAGKGDQASAQALLLENPSDPVIWSAYAEFLSANGQVDQASQAFDRAVALGSSASAVLMRAANFYFTHDRQKQGLALVPTILSQTDSNDQILFLYLMRTQIPVKQFLGTEIPATARPAQAFLEWLRGDGNGSLDDLRTTWSWMVANHLADEDTATGLVNAAWNQRSYAFAREVWTQWSQDASAARGQLFRNDQFANEPRRVPFDWDLRSAAGVAIERGNGITVRFLGTDNVELNSVRQVAVVAPGRYRLEIDFSAENLTTNEGPFFRFTDIDDARRLSIETMQIHGSVARCRQNLDFTVPAATQAIRIEIVRNSSYKFDNKIEGTLHVYQVSLTPLVKN